MDTNLKDLRTYIDYIDNKLVTLLNLRFQYCCVIGQEKKKLQAPILDNNREQEIIERLKQYEQYPGMIEAIWPIIMEFSKSIQ